ncbi:hypothetical protein AYI70_g10963, partial [Smittium culicis]
PDSQYQNNYGFEVVRNRYLNRRGNFINRNRHKRYRIVFIRRKRRYSKPASIHDTSAEKPVSNFDLASKKVADNVSADALNSGSQKISGNISKRIVVEQIIKPKAVLKLKDTSNDGGKAEKEYLDQLENLIGNEDSTPSPTYSNIEIKKNETVFQTQLQTQFQTEFETQNQTNYNTVNTENKTRNSTISVTKSASN